MLKTGRHNPYNIVLRPVIVTVANIPGSAGASATAPSTSSEPITGEKIAKTTGASESVENEAIAKATGAVSFHRKRLRSWATVDALSLALGVGGSENH